MTDRPKRPRADRVGATKRRWRGEPEVLVFDDPAKLARAGAERVVRALTTAVAQRGVAHLALSGGSSPVALYRLLAGLRDIPWAAVHLWWSDDRFVPPDHPESNTALVRDTLLRADAEKAHGAGVPAGNVHPFPIPAGLEGGRGPEWVAEAYAKEILRHVPTIEGRPAFDVMLLGVGPDGHVMSAFPGSPALAPNAPLVLAIPAPTSVEPHLPRLTLRPRVADDAVTLLVLVPDGAKAAVVARALEGRRNERRLPAQVARRQGATWLLSRAAAAGLRGGSYALRVRPPGGGSSITLSATSS